jgi:thiamine pyrophosphate-dependent acetolactate synthase large subunit-like protein
VYNCVLLRGVQVLHLLKASHRPLLLLGGGAVGVDASLLGELVDVLDMPVVYTWMGKVRGAHRTDLVQRCDYQYCKRYL